MKQIIAIFLLVFGLASCKTQCDCEECCKTHCKTEQVIDSTSTETQVEVETETENTEKVN